MKLSKIRDQDFFLYDLKWNAAMDTKLLDIMLEHKEECHATPAYEAPHVLVEAVTKLNQTSSKLITLSDIEERANFLHGRFSCFKRLMSMPATHWDKEANCIIAADVVWKKIIKENNFAAAYYRSGDPAHLKMFNLFDNATIKTELSHTLIIISDTLSEHDKTEKVTYDISSDDDVTSPQLVEASRARKKLFPNANDAHSTAQPSEITPPRDDMRFPPRNAFPMKPLDFGVPSKEAKAALVLHAALSSSGHIKFFAHGGVW